MEILVCIKQVPDDSVDIKMNPATGAPAIEKVTPVVNAFDTYALEMATRLKEAVGGNITVISIGDANDSVKNCLAVGGDNGYVIKADVNDPISTASALAKAVPAVEEAAGVKFDIIFLGKEATDCASGQVGALLAAELDAPVVPNLIDIATVDGGVSCKQETDDGYKTIEAPLPAVVTVTKPNYDPRYPTIKSKMAARKKKIAEIPVDGVAAPVISVIAMAEPPKKAAGVKFNEEAIEDSFAKAIDVMKAANVF